MKFNHILGILNGSQQAYPDRTLVGLQTDVASPAGNGTVTAVAAGTPGTGYTSIPTVALANVGSGSGAAVTAVMGVQSATVAAGGSGGTTGTQTVTGTTGTGTKFTASVTIAGGAITAVNSITLAGAYTALPTDITQEPVTGASLTGAKLALSMGVVSYTVGSAGSNYPVSGVTATVSGGSPTAAAVPGAVTVTSAAGASSKTTVTFTGSPLPAKYGVEITPNQPCMASVSNKTASGFDVTLTPLSGVTLAAGTFDALVIA